MLPVIRSLWIGKELSLLERLVVSSFIANGHSFELYVYEDVAGVPQSVTTRDARDIIPRREIFTRYGSLALFADWFRWKLLQERGGFWVDMDVVCLKPFDFEEEVVFGLQEPDVANIAVLRFPRAHPLTTHMVRRCEEQYDVGGALFHNKVRQFICRLFFGNDKNHLPWGETAGPPAFSTVLRDFELFDRAKPTGCFYPVSFIEWRSVFDGSLSEESLPPEAYAIHFWNELVRNSELNKNDVFPDHSLIESLKRRYFTRNERG